MVWFYIHVYVEHLA